MKVLVTGASGFVGRALVERLRSDAELQVRLTLRRAMGASDVEFIKIEDISGTTDWRMALEGIDVVVHLAARAHILNDHDADPLPAFRRVNTQGTLNLAQQAQIARVKRFIFISTIGVNGAQTQAQALTEDSPVSPHSPYAQSKYEAECGLLGMIKPGGMEIVIIRPPMIFGVQAPGNFARLLKLISFTVPLPLPFGRMCNRRSLVSLTNLIDFIVICLTRPQAANELFLISDGDDVSTEEMVRCLARGMGSRRWLFPFPEFIVRWLANAIRKENIYIQLYGSLQVDASKARNLLQWEPCISSRLALEDSGRKYKSG